MLEILAIRDKDWRRMAFQICKDKSKADDLVQEMYLKFANYNKEVNDFYVFFAIRSIYLNQIKKNKDFSFITEGIEKIECFNDEYDFYKDAIQQLNIDKINSNIPKLPYFERELISVTVGVRFDKKQKGFVDSLKITQTELSKQTDINYMTINKTILKTKKNIKNELWQSK
jgi:hypothetical protein